MSTLLALGPHFKKNMILQSWAEAAELTFQNYFYHMLAKRVKNRMENFSVLAEGGRRKPRTSNIQFPKLYIQNEVPCSRNSMSVRAA